jgi:hypothetical protein
MIDYFGREALASGCDVVAALTSYSQVMAKYPGMRRTRIRFRNGDFCGCNLYAFLTPEGHAAADFWRRVENQRKRPVRMLNELGWLVLLRYLFGRLTCSSLPAGWDCGRGRSSCPFLKRLWMSIPSAIWISPGASHPAQRAGCELRGKVKR